MAQKIKNKPIVEDFERIKKLSLTIDERKLVANKYIALANLYDAKNKLAKINAELTKGGIEVKEW